MPYKEKEIEARVKLNKARVPDAVESIIEAADSNTGISRSIEEKEIDKQLDDEFQKWYKKIKEQYQKVKEAEDRLNSFMSDDENEEFKKLYRQLVFKLHPDLNPNQTKDEENLWHRVQLTYKSGDLEEMRSLMIILEAQDSAVELPSSKDILEKRQTNLAKQIQKIINHMSELEQAFPFNIVGKLADKAWVNTKVEEIQEQIHQWQEKCEHYEALIKVLLVIKETRVN